MMNYKYFSFDAQGNRTKLIWIHAQDREKKDIECKATQDQTIPQRITHGHTRPHMAIESNSFP